MTKMIVQAIMEFDIDVDDLDPKYHEAYAKSYASAEMDFLIHGPPSLCYSEPRIGSDDFVYIVKGENT
jgi:hypothetical protein